METGPIYVAEIMKNLNIIFHFDDSNNDNLAMTRRPVNIFRL